MRLVGDLLGLFLHLARIVNVHLHFGRQGQRRPDARIRQSPLFVCVERDFDLDGALNLGGIASR